MHSYITYEFKFFFWFCFWDEWITLSHYGKTNKATGTWNVGLCFHVSHENTLLYQLSLCFNNIPTWWIWWWHIANLETMYNVVRDILKLPDDNGKIPKLNRLVDSSIPVYEIVSLLDGKLAGWSSVSCVPTKRKPCTILYKSPLLRCTQPIKYVCQVLFYS